MYVKYLPASSLRLSTHPRAFLLAELHERRHGTLGRILVLLCPLLLGGALGCRLRRLQNHPSSTVVQMIYVVIGVREHKTGAQATLL